MHGTHSRSLELVTHLRPKPRPTDSTGQWAVNLALQGGGSHGPRRARLQRADLALKLGEDA